MKRSRVAMAAALTSVMMLAAACGGQKTENNTPASGGTNTQTEAPKVELKGEIKIDGSSTVYPITQAVAEEFQKLHKGNVKVPVGISGSSAGFGKWLKGEIDINDSSRKIKATEIEEAKKAGFDAIEIPVAYDGLSVVVSKEVTWTDCITTAELKTIWHKDSKVKTWKEVNPAWPAEPLKLYGPGTASGTFEYFTEHINGKAKESRTDYTASEDDNVLVTGVSGNKGAMGYFGYAYAQENKEQLKTLKIDGGKGCIEPNDKTIADLSYPLARLIYIYPSTKAMERPEVKEFVKFYLENAEAMVKQAKYTPLTKAQYEESLAKIK